VGVFMCVFLCASVCVSACLCVRVVCALVCVCLSVSLCACESVHKEKLTPWPTWNIFIRLGQFSRL